MAVTRAEAVALVDREICRSAVAVAQACLDAGVAWEDLPSAMGPFLERMRIIRADALAMLERAGATIH